MKSLRYSLLTVFGLIIFFSCEEKKQETIVLETPAALQENKVDMKSYGRYSQDLTEELYAGLLEQNPSLKQLEEDLTTYRPHPAELSEVFENYNSKSADYYTSANHKAEMIRDSVLKQMVADFIMQSSERYVKKTAKINGLLKQISENNLDINDHHTVLKIVLTLPLIEKYQSDHAVNDKLFKDLLKEQEGLMKQTDKLIPQF